MDDREDPVAGVVEPPDRAVGHQRTYTVTVTKSALSDSIYVDGKVCVENVSQAPTENLKVVDRLQALVGDDIITPRRFRST